MTIPTLSIENQETMIPQKNCHPTSRRYRCLANPATFQRKINLSRFSPSLKSIPEAK
jgi:hypothetical protein